MSALPPKADMDQRRRDVRFVPIADMERDYQAVHFLARAWSALTRSSRA